MLWTVNFPETALKTRMNIVKYFGVFLLKHCSGVSFVDFKQLNASWGNHWVIITEKY